MRFASSNELDARNEHCDDARLGGLSHWPLRLTFLLLALISTSSLPAAANCLLDGCVRGGSFELASVSRTTGDSELDARIWTEASGLIRAFEIQPSMLLYDDLEAPNAFASVQSTAAGHFGTVYFGRRLISGLLSTEAMGEAALVVVMAHEWSHILQLANGFPDQAPSRVRELHADLLAGWYLGRRNLAPPGNVSSLAVPIYQHNGYHDLSVLSHGSVDSRTMALLFGYQRAEMPLGAVYQMGLEFVLTYL